MKKLLLGGILLSMFFLVVVCGNLDVTSSPTPTAQPTQPQPTPKPKSLKQQLDTIVQNTDHRDQNAHTALVGTSFSVTEDFNQLSLLSNNDLVEDFKQDCYNLQRAIWTNRVSERLTQVEVIFTLDTQDKYGKVYPHTKVGSCTLTHKTAALFHWDNLIADDTWNLYDSTFLIPFLTS